MTLIQLEQFVMIAEHQNISKAAESLYMNQSNLSRSINSLEKELGVKLFRRTNTGVELTQDGQYCLPFAKRILAHIKSISTYCSDMSKLGTMRSNAKRLIIASPSYDFLPVVSFLFRDRYPNIALNANIYEISGNMALDQVQNNEVDFAITTCYPFSEARKLKQIADRDLKVIPLGELPTGVFMKRTIDTMNDTYADLSKTAGQTLFILRPGEIIIDEARAYFESKGMDFLFSDIVRATSYGYITRAISILGGYAFATRMSDMSNMYPGTIYKRFDPAIVPNSKLFAILRKDAEPDPIVDNFIELIKEQIGVIEG